MSFESGYKCESSLDYGSVYERFSDDVDEQVRECG